MLVDSPVLTIGSRRYDVDWLRVLANYFMVPIHVAVVFSPWPFFHIRNHTVSAAMLVFWILVEAWIMPLFFLLAGWSLFHSLRARGGRGFVQERVRKLLIPLVVGCVLLGPPIKYLELRSGFDANYLSCCPCPPATHYFGPCIPSGADAVPPFDEAFSEFWPTFFTRFERFTWSHLWFLGYLFTLSLVYLPLFVWLMKTRHNLARASAAWLYLPMIPLLVIEITLRPYWPGLQNLYNDWANLAYYSTCLISGFLLARYPVLEQALRREWKRALRIGIAGMALRVPTAASIILSPTLSFVSLVVAGWATSLALLGFAHSHLNRTNAILDYLRESAFPVYVLHQGAIVSIGYRIIQLPLRVPPGGGMEYLPAKFLLLLVAVLAATLVTYQFIVRPIPILRFAFGMQPLPRRRQLAREQARDHS